ncbi:MarR family winged helix-turn-helix transcriptional regulator [Rhizobium sp. CCGE 510]|uniref:MarR family winged helix-turn-helix transcriptional regulator n=1 Tax=Rhizobium sp. CCGE 510 TaxID=1132836 RepID=UPI00027B8584|nr:MarR family winged helix-turn-helix transcriptional regulator [Rhizobium sp. CCGE 510]EJT07304.1 transcriptional regulator protein [Rhizobium sp. CCGE 510]
MPNKSLGRELIEDIAAFSRKLRVAFDALVKERDMTLPRARVFFALNTKDGINQRELADKLELETPTLVRILDTMEGQGFVERRVPGFDRRAKEIYLTESGRVSAGEVEEIAWKMRARVVAGIPESDLRTTLSVIRAMQANLQTMRGS